MNEFTKRFFATAALVAVCIAPASAAARWDGADDRSSITAIGDGKVFIGDCTGKAVQLVGDRQTIALFGKCKSIVSRGSYKRITLDGATSLQVTGTGNTVKWKVKPTSVNALGKNNSLTSS